MCFSATASFTTGALLLGTGIFTLRQVKHLSSMLFASIPLIFGIQQIIEGLVWVSFSSPFLHSLAVNMFVFIAYVFWPIYVPLSLYFLEEEVLRKKIFKILSWIGFFIGTYLFFHILFFGAHSSIVENSICYNVPVSFPYISFGLYFLSVGISILVSSVPKIRIFGSTILLSFFIAHTYYPETSFSVWCFFSALLSIIIYSHLIDLKKIFHLKI